MSLVEANGRVIAQRSRNDARILLTYASIKNRQPQHKGRKRPMKMDQRNPFSAMLQGRLNKEELILHGPLSIPTGIVARWASIERRVVATLNDESHCL